MSPKIWSRFTRINDGTEIKLRIQEVSEAKYEEVLDLFMKYHTPEEPLRIISGIYTAQFIKVNIKLILNCIGQVKSIVLQGLKAMKKNMVRKPVTFWMLTNAKCGCMPNVILKDLRAWRSCRISSNLLDWDARDGLNPALGKMFALFAINFFLFHIVVTQFRLFTKLLDRKY